MAKDDVGPALAAGRAVVELAKTRAVRSFLREFRPDAGSRQPVENAELALPQPLVDDRLRRTAGKRPGLADQFGRLPRPDVGRAQDDLRPLQGWKCSKVSPRGFG